VKGAINRGDGDSKSPGNVLDTRWLLSFVHATCILAQPRRFAFIFPVASCTLPIKSLEMLPFLKK
jgi:hypothetical protein